MLDLIVDWLGYATLFLVIALITWFITTAVYAFFEGFAKGYREAKNKLK